MGGSDAGEDYEHWPDESKHYEKELVAAAGYDSYNGLHRFTYHPANAVQEKAAPAPTPQAQPAPVHFTYAAPAPQIQPQQMPFMTCYPPMQYGYPPQMAYPMPAYFGYPQPGAPVGAPAGYTHIYQPAAPPPEEKKELKAPEPRKWQGRTKAEVEEDNMKIAMREGAYDERKVEPKGLNEDQIVWVVEVDGSHTLRWVVVPSCRA